MSANVPGSLIPASLSRPFLPTHESSPPAEDQLSKRVPTVREIMTQREGVHRANSNPTSLSARLATRAEIRSGRSLSLTLPNSAAPLSLTIPPVKNTLSFDSLRDCFKVKCLESLEEVGFYYQQDNLEGFTLKHLGEGVNNPYVVSNSEGDAVFIIKPLVPPDNLLKKWVTIFDDLVKKWSDFFKKNEGEVTSENLISQGLMREGFSTQEIAHIVSTDISPEDLSRLMSVEICNQTNNSYFDFIPFESQLIRERLAYVLGAELGVPACTIIKHPEHGFCSKHEFVESRGTWSTMHSELTQGNVDAQSVQNICLLDLLLISQDRNSTNILVKAGESGFVLIPIDHGYTLPMNLSFVNMRSCLTDNDAAFSQGVRLTEASLQWMKELNWAIIEGKLNQVGGVDEATKKAIRLSSLLLKTIGQHPLAEALSVDQLFTLFYKFENKVRVLCQESTELEDKDLFERIECLHFREFSTQEEFFERVVAIIFDELFVDLHAI